MTLEQAAAQSNGTMRPHAEEEEEEPTQPTEVAYGAVGPPWAEEGDVPGWAEEEPTDVHTQPDARWYLTAERRAVVPG